MAAARPTSGVTVGLFALAMFWAGLLVGVAFLATPAKFLAPSLALPVALDVGRHTFAVFNKAEWGLAAALLLLAVARLRDLLGLAGAALAALLVLVETVWLLPLLDQRLGLFIAGRPPPPSHHHTLYIALETAKLIALAGVAAAMARRLRRPPQQM